MKNIESYNSSYPLAYYEIGAVYSFYGQAAATGTPASLEAVKKYATVLNELVSDEQENAIKPVKGGAGSANSPSKMNRFYAVVIDKEKHGKYAFIVVMFCNKHNGQTGYFTRKYSVNYGCMTDGKDLMPASSHLGFSTNTSGKVGGVTLAGKGQKVGGITLANGKSKPTGSVGGITKVNKPNNSNATSSSSVGKVGGITRAKK